MTVKVFLSLSSVDRSFVLKVRSRLPAGLAHYYEKSFRNGEDLLNEMARTINDSCLFVLFASPESIESRAVNFEIDNARLAQFRGKMHRILT